MSIKKPLAHPQQLNFDQENTPMSLSSKSSFSPTYKIDGFTQFQPIVDRYTQVIDELLVQACSYKKQIRTLKTKIQELQQQYAQKYILNETPQEKERAIRQLKEKIQQLQNQGASLKRQANFYEEQLSYKNEQLKNLRKQNKNLTEMVKNLQEQKMCLQNDKKKQVLEAQLASNKVKKELHNLKNVIVQLEDEKRVQYIDFRAKIEHIKKLQSEIQSLASQNQYLHQKIKKQERKQLDNSRKSMISSRHSQKTTKTQKNVNSQETLMLKTQIAKLQQQKIHLEKLLRQQVQTNQVLKRQIPDLCKINQKNSKVAHRDQKIEKQYIKILKENARLQRQLDSICKQQMLNNRKQAKSQNKNKTVKFEQQTQDLKSSLLLLRRQNQQFKKKIENISNELQRYQNQLQKSNYKKQILQQELAYKITLQKKCDELILERVTMMKQIDSLKSQMQLETRAYSQQMKKINQNIRIHEDNNARIKKQIHYGHKQNLQELTVQIQRLQNRNEQIQAKFQLVNSQLLACQKKKEHVMKELQQQLSKKNNQIQLLCGQLQQAIKRINNSILTQQRELEQQLGTNQKEYRQQKQILSLKTYYQNQVKQLVSQINHLTKACHHLSSQNQRYLQCQAELQIAKRKLQQPLLGVNLEHLWSIKQIQCNKMAQVIRKIKK